MKPIIQKIVTLTAMLLSMLTASAYDFEYNGMYFNILSTGNLTCEITEGDVKYEGNISIPSEVEYKGRTLKVTSIGWYAFNECSSLASVTIPNSVTVIGGSAFFCCSSLSSVTIPNSVTKIGESAFYECSNLSSVTIPNSVTYIGYEAFYGCSSLVSVTIPNSVTVIGGSAFFCCSSLSSVTIPNSVTVIGGSVFFYCSSLSSVTIPKSVTEIGKSAFEGCSSLSSVTIPNSVTSIGDAAFSGCSSLASVIIPNSVTEIGESAFYGCSSLSSVTIPNSVNNIGKYCFAKCSKLQKIEIEKGDNKFEFEYGIFEEDDALTDIVIGREKSWSWRGFKNRLCLENITNLTFLDDIDLDESNWNFFQENDFSTTLINLTIGNNVKNYPVNLREYSKLQTITLKDPVPRSCPSFVSKQYTDMIVYVPKGALAAYQNHNGWKNFWDIRESEESGIDDAAVVDEKVEIGRYDLQGRRVGGDYRGMVIVRFSDGSVRKTIVR